jgi:O-antigen ligase
MVVAMPIIAYLALGNHGGLHKAVGVFGVFVCLLGIVGTASRGSSLGLAGALLFYWMFVSRRKLRSALAVVMLALVVVIFAPSGYLDRMNSIKSYEVDSSAQSRLMLWGAAISMARDYPLGVGAGNFASAYGRFYSPVGERSGNASEYVWAPGRWLNAHSVYFKTLGEYGVLGLGLLVALIVVNFRDCFVARARLLALGDRAHFTADWPGLLAMSFCGFAICAIFLGGLAYPHLFLLSGLVVATVRLAEAAPLSDGETPSAVPAWSRRSRPGLR